MVLRKPILSEIETERANDLSFQTSQVDPGHLRGGASAQLTVSSPDLTRAPAMSPEHSRAPPLEVRHGDNFNSSADELVERPQPVNLPTHNTAGVAQWTRDEGQLCEEEQLSAPRKPTFCLNEPTGTPGKIEVSSSIQYPTQLQSNNPFLKAKQQRSGSWSDPTVNRCKTGFSLSDDTASFQSNNANTSLADKPRSESSPPACRTNKNDIDFHSPPFGTQRDESVPWFSFTSNPDANNIRQQDDQPPSAINHPPTQTVSPILERASGLFSGKASGVPPVLTASVIPADSFPSLIEAEDTRYWSTQEQSEGKLTAEETRTTESSEKVPSPSLVKMDKPSLLDGGDSGPLRLSPVAESPDAEPPPAQTAGSSAQQSQLDREQDKKSETYDILHINWTDRTTVLRQSPILVQNKNGPCPLLALVNGLVMRAGPKRQPPIVKALQSREKISLGLLIQALFDELTSYNEAESELPDIEALSTFLTMLHKGMNVNPCLIPITIPWYLPGTFLETPDTRLYSAFNLPLVHGWLAEPSSDAHASLTRVAQYHEDIQLLHFRKEELEQKVFNGGTLTSAEEQMMRDIDNIQRFVDVENATQLSAFGLEHLTRSMDPGAVGILFRNDHFSTLFKHPLSDQLFTLVTDAGYAGHAEIVWESLVDVNGSNDLFSGDFRPVRHTPVPQSGRSPDAQGADIVSRRVTSRNNTNSCITNIAVQHTEQTDADYAFALALQFQDEEERRASESRSSRVHANRRSSSPRVPSWESGSTAHSRSASSIANGNRQSTSGNTGRRTSRQTQDIRPLIPPRNIRKNSSRADPLTVDTTDGPPPTYEQAARSPAYIPPVDHPQYDGSGVIGSRPSNHSSHVDVGNTQSNISHHRSSRSLGANSALTPLEGSRGKDKNKDCVVM